MASYRVSNEKALSKFISCACLRVWWRAGRMTAGTVVITGGILATVILLCIIAVLCYCRLQVCLYYFTILYSSSHLVLSGVGFFFRNIEISASIFIKGHKKPLGRWGIHLSSKNRIFELCNRRSVTDAVTQETVEVVLKGNYYWEYPSGFSLFLFFR